MAVSKNAHRGTSGQPDHQTRKYVKKSRKGIPIHSWCETTMTNGQQTQVWS